MQKLFQNIFFFSLVTFSTNIFAQVDTSTTQKLLQYIFQNIDKSYVPTGFLAEYGCPILPMQTFNGTLTDSNRIDINLWRTLYFQLQTAYVGSGTNLLPDIRNVNNSISSLTTQGIVNIPMLVGRYNTVGNNSFNNGLLNYNSQLNQIFYSTSKPQSVYSSNNVFAACPVNNITNSGSPTFSFNTNLFYSNTGAVVKNLMVDFGDGNGMQQVDMNTKKTISPLLHLSLTCYALS